MLEHCISLGVCRARGTARPGSATILECVFVCTIPRAKSSVDEVIESAYTFLCNLIKAALARIGPPARFEHPVATVWLWYVTH